MSNYFTENDHIRKYTGSGSRGIGSPLKELKKLERELNASNAKQEKFEEWMDSLLEGLIDLVKEFPNKEMDAKIRFLKIIIAKLKQPENAND